MEIFNTDVSLENRFSSKRINFFVFNFEGKKKKFERIIRLIRIKLKIARTSYYSRDNLIGRSSSLCIPRTIFLLLSTSPLFFLLLLLFFITCDANTDKVIRG